MLAAFSLVAAQFRGRLCHLLLVPLLASLVLMTSCSGKRLPETCYLQPESGTCRASFTRWYLDDRTGVCKAFIWGGCGGVAPFETQQDCAAQCMPGQSAAAPAAPPLANTAPAVAPQTQMPAPAETGDATVAP